MWESLRRSVTWRSSFCLAKAAPMAVPKDPPPNTTTLCALSKAVSVFTPLRLKILDHRMRFLLRRKQQLRTRHPIGAHAASTWRLAVVQGHKFTGHLTLWLRDQSTMWGSARIPRISTASTRCDEEGHDCAVTLTQLSSWSLDVDAPLDVCSDVFDKVCKAVNKSQNWTAARKHMLRHFLSTKNTLPEPHQCSIQTQVLVENVQYSRQVLSSNLQLLHLVSAVNAAFKLSTSPHKHNYSWNTAALKKGISWHQLQIRHIALST